MIISIYNIIYIDIIYTNMIVILDCHLILSYALGNRLYRASKYLLYWLEKSATVSLYLGFISSPFNHKTAYSVVILVMLHIDLALKRVIALKSEELLSIRKDFINRIHFNFSFHFTFRVQLMKAAIMQTTLTITKIDHILFILLLLPAFKIHADN